MMIYLMLRPPVVFHAVMEVDLLKLVAVRQRASADVHLVLRVFLHAEDQGLACVLENAADLVEEIQFLGRLRVTAGPRNKNS